MAIITCIVSRNGAGECALTRNQLNLLTRWGREMFAYTSRNMKIYWQLLMLPLVAVIGFSLISFMQFSEVKVLRQVSVSSANQMATIARLRNIQNTFTQTRICEKNFLITHSPEDLQAQQKMLAATYEEIKKAKNEIANPEETRALSNWKRQLDTYKTKFEVITRELTRVGLDSNSGLRGTIRNSAELIERTVKQRSAALSASFSSVRTAEHRFQHVPSAETKNEWTREATAFERQLAQSTLSQGDMQATKASWQAYTTAFTQLMDASFNLAADRILVDAISANVLSSITSASGKAMDRERKLTMSGYSAFEDNFLFLLAFTGLIGFTVVVIAWRVGTGMSRPLGDLREAMLSLAYGNYETRIPAGDYRNEIGEMAKSVMVWRENAKERVHARNLLKKANDQTQGVFKAMADGIFETDAMGVVKLVNPAAEKMMKAKPGALIGQSICDIFDTTDIPSAKGKQEDGATHGLACSEAVVGPGRPVERKLKSRDGEHMVVHLSSSHLKDGNGDLCGFVCVVRDISTQVQSDRKIKQLKSTLDRISGEIYMFDKDSLKFSYVNKAAQERICAETKCAPSDIPVLTPIDVTSYLTQAAFRERLAPLVDGSESTIVYESTRTFSDGRVVPQEILIQLIEEVDGPSRFIAFVNDISDRKTAEQDIMRLKATLDSSSDAVFMFNPDDLKFIYLNAAAKAQTGWDDEESKGKTPVDINPIFDEQRFRMLTKPLVFGTQKTIVLTTDGILGEPIELTVELFDTDKHETWFVVTTRDISIRKEAEREIRQLRQTLDQSEDFVYMFDPETMKFMYLNKAARKDAGWNSKELREKTPKDVDPKFSFKAFRETAQPLLDGSAKQVRYETTDKQGRPTEVSLQLIKPDSGKPRFVAFTRDITERKAAEKAKTEFISTISHELRTPLTSIKGALGIIQAGAAGEMNEKLDSLVTIALSNSNRLVNLINDILDIEKIQAGKMNFNLQPMDICALVDESIIVNEAYGKPLNVSFAATGTDKPLMVNGDGDRLMQVMSNLLSNAAKFSHKGATVTVDVKPHDGKIRVSVIDTGSGIPQSAQATIFDKFTQADSSDQRKKGGTGLGLSIVKMMVEAHGGTINFNSVENEGTTFYFDLDQVEGESGNVDLAPTPQNASKTILICEDEPDIANILKMTLEGAGYHADIAPTAKDALEMLTANNYDGMTLDLNLPDFGGMELLAELRMVKSLARLPVFVISGYSSDNETQKEGQDLGVIDWMAKPIDARRLIAGLEKALLESANVVPEILHVEDDDSVCKIVREIVGAHAMITTATSLESAKRHLADRRFDLVILDLDLPDGKGEQLLTELSATPDRLPPVVVFSAEEGNAAIAAAADAVLIKSRATNEEFLRMIEWGLKAEPHIKRRVAAE